MIHVRNQQDAREKAVIIQKAKRLVMIYLRRLVRNWQDAREKAVTMQTKRSVPICPNQPVRNLQDAGEKAATTQKEKPLVMIFLRQLVQRQQNVRGKVVIIERESRLDMI